MEATRFGFDPSLPSTYEFDPTDADIVVHYLLPRVIGFPNPYAHAVIDDDPYSCPPWELMRRHGHEGSDHAFFFGPVRAERRRGALRLNRRVPAGEGGGGGGTWLGLAKGVEQDLVVVRGESGDAKLKLKFKKWLLSYRDDEKRATGGVMDEYQITEPPRGAVLSRIRMTSRAMRERKKRQQAAAAATAAEADQQLVPGPEQPGPSNYLDDGGPIAGNFVVMDNGEGTSGGAQVEVLHQCGKNGGSMGEAPGYYDYCERDSLLGETAGYYSAFLGDEEDGGSGGD